MWLRKIIHFARVFGTVRKQLRRLGILGNIERNDGDPVISDFEESTNQAHLKDRKGFQKRDFSRKGPPSSARRSTSPLNLHASWRWQGSALFGNEISLIS